MDIQKDKYSITELSEILDVTDHALRFYEKEFCLNIPKDDRGRRYYTRDLANTMYRIKAMRNEGLEIKAIKKILQSENEVSEQAAAVSEDAQVSVYTTELTSMAIQEVRYFFDEFKSQLASEISSEISSASELLSHEIKKSKLELGACVENGMRRLEAKMERHFDEVDKALGVWREKNRRGIFKRLLSKTIHR